MRLLHNFGLVAARADHSDCDCFAVAVLSHGNDGILKGTDSESIVIEDFIAPIKSCETLVGKPKIFIFQVGSVSVLSALIML